MFLAVAAVCLAGMSNPHPHAIRDSADAISTAYADWAASVGEMSDAKQWSLWKSTYSAKREGTTWHLIPHPAGARYSGQGTHIRIDGKTGCVVSEISFG